MQTTRNQMPEPIRQFFFRMGEYMDLPLYFYGSVQRPDYVPGKSDIDLMIFAASESREIDKLSHFLNKTKSDFRKFVWNVKGDVFVYGYKLKYEDPSIALVTEISIYNIRFQPLLELEHTRKFVLPFYISWMLVVIKTLYYRCGLITSQQFKQYKRWVLNSWMGDLDTLYLLLENPTTLTASATISATATAATRNSSNIVVNLT